MRDSNPRPPQCQCDALPTAPTALLFSPEDGFEPPLEDPESPVLPLDDSGIRLSIKKDALASYSIETPRVGLEPTTLRLTAECSAIELPRNVSIQLLYSNKKIMQILF